MIPFIGKKHSKKKEKPIPSGLRLASIQLEKEPKVEWETVSLWIKTWFHSMEKKLLKEERETNSLRIKTCFHPIGKESKVEWETISLWTKTWFHSVAKRTQRRKRNQFLKD